MHARQEYRLLPQMRRFSTGSRESHQQQGPHFMAGLHRRICAASLALALSTHAFSSEPALPVTQTAEVQYRLVELPPVQVNGQEAFLLPGDMNNRGEVLATDQGFPARSFIYRQGKIVRELTSPDPAFPILHATGINNRSEVVGSLTNSVD